MTHLITAVIVDNAMADPKPVVVECRVEGWANAFDAVLSVYALKRGGMRNFDLDALELRSMTMMFVQPIDL